MLKLALLGTYHRTTRITRQLFSLHFSRTRRYPASPKTLGEHLRKKRIDLALSMPKLAKLLGFDITDTAIEKWEKNQNQPTEPYRSRIVEFLGFDPELENQRATPHDLPVGNLPPRMFDKMFLLYL
jgi:DNA-binding transcriptional regulator YiaG